MYHTHIFFKIQHTLSVIKHGYCLPSSIILLILMQMPALALANEPDLTNKINTLFSGHKENTSLRILIKPKRINTKLRPSLSSNNSAEKSSLHRINRELGIQSARILKTDNIAAYEINKNQVKKLLRAGLIEDLQEDRLLSPSLMEARPWLKANSYHQQGLGGQGYAVAILDSGIHAEHHFFEGRVVEQACFSTNSANATSLCPNGQMQQIGGNAAKDCYSNLGLSACHHGTHVAGIAAGSNNTMKGIAPEASIVAIQVFSHFDSSYPSCRDNPNGCLLAYYSDVLAALEWLRDSANTPNIIAANLSLGSSRSELACDTAFLKPVIDNLRQQNTATIIAAGNNGYLNSLNYPACISSAISVGASYDTSDDFASYSNRSPLLDIVAPGETITSSISGGVFAAWGGTSMATPMVTGAMALLKQQHPAKTVDEIENIIKENAIAFYDPASERNFPRLNLNLEVDTTQPFREVFEAEEGDHFQSNTGDWYRGYNGEGFVILWNTANSHTQFNVDIPVAGNYTLTIRHSDGSWTDKTLEFFVNNEFSRHLEFSHTRGWINWTESEINLPLNAGLNTLKFYNPTWTGSPAIDRYTITSNY